MRSRARSSSVAKRTLAASMLTASLDAPVADVLDVAPVLEGIGDQRVAGDRGDGLVPVADLDCRQADVDDVVVGAVLRHIEPVAHAQHVVGGELDAGDEPQDRVLDYQQQDGGHRVQPAEQKQWRLADQQGNRADQGDDRAQELDALEKPPERQSGCELHGAGYVAKGVQYREHGQEREEDDPEVAEHCDERQDCRLGIQQNPRERVDGDALEREREAREDAVAVMLDRPAGNGGSPGPGRR